MKLRLGQAETKSLALICENIFCQCILSWQNLQALGIISASFPLPDPAKPRTAAISDSATPFIPSQEDEAALTQCTSDLIKSFPSVLSDTLPDTPMITDSPMTISINPNSDVKPLNIATARAVPRAYESESLKVTEMLLEKRVIAAVSKPTKWCSPGFFVPKPGGQGRIRLVVDYKQLNQAILRQSTLSRAPTTSCKPFHHPPNSSVSWTP